MLLSNTRHTVFLFFLILILSGCLQSKEHFTIQPDGSGTIDMALFIPTASLQMLDEMMGQMGQLQGGTEAGGSGQKPSDMAESLFGSRDTLLRKAQDSGLNLEFTRFNKAKRADGLHVDYQVKFTDIAKLMQTDVSSAGFTINKDAQGNWVCELKANPAKLQESQSQMGQFQSFKQSENFQSINPIMQAAMASAMAGFRVEVLITMPYPIKEITGVFKRADSSTAMLEFSGDILSDPSVMQRMYGDSSPVSRVVWESAGPAIALFQPAPVAQPPNSLATVKIYLKNGRMVEGRLIEKTDQYIKIDAYGVGVTYYQDEIAKVE